MSSVYWNRMTRRGFMRAGGVAGVGVAAALVGCRASTPAKPARA